MRAAEKTELLKSSRALLRNAHKCAFLTSPRFLKFSLSTLSMPIFIVTVELGHVPHAPCKISMTLPVLGSTAETATLPPSEIR